ncbi:hypothetical protein OIU76_006482 [Salix suchowensis]|nr:hypothetical protein OIU76_006482 [Salix suchowensis]
MEDVKHKSRKDDSERKEEKEDSKRSHRDRERERERNGERHRDREKRERERESTRRSDRDKSSDSDDKEREKEKHKDRDKDRAARSKDRNRDRDKEGRDKERDKDREEKRDRDKDREEKRDREKEREEKRDREKEREEKRERERAKEKDREREREKREREKERDRERRERDREEREREKRERERERRTREREKRRELISDSDDDSKDRDKKRRRRDDDDYKERVREQSISRSNRHKDNSEESPRKTSDEEDSDKNAIKTREEELEQEQKKLDEEMEKRRRRVQEWQELRRRKEETEIEKHGEEANVNEPKTGKTWTLDGESDDEEAPPTGKSETDMDLEENAKPDEDIKDAMVEDTENDIPAPQNEDDAVNGDEEIDPLDAFMNSMVLPEVEKLNSTLATHTADDNKADLENKDKKEERINGEQRKKSFNKSLGRIVPGEDSDSDYGDLENGEDPLEEEDDDEFMKRVKKTKAEKLSIVDHSKIDYNPFRKNFYIEVKEISRMTPEEVAAYRKELELKLHGKDVPKPIKTWHQTGLTSKILEMIKKLNYEKPMTIQAQALPIIMSGRDCIGIAKTGSGKTLAFVLPMLRHIKDQPPVEAGEGPIGLVMAPTRELVQQIHSDIKKFGKVLGIRCVPVYGGSGVAQQISELKRGTEIVVCTPGRMIDILCTSGGKITNLRRVTYLVMDEADRMFDMGFEPQITRIVQNIRPDRQTVLFSATFPRQVETLARKVLNKPVEIQDKCDSLFRNLLKFGYPCLSLHGGKDQTDRESTISDFKTNVCNLLIATSVAARGLDVKDLELVINYDVPNHYEDYVHRVGRTGRAGRKGCAITFISEDDVRYAPDLVKALELSEQVVPQDLKALADEEDEKRMAAKKAQAKEYGYEDEKSDSEDEDDVVRKSVGDISQQTALAQQIAALAAVSKIPVPAPPISHSVVQLLSNGGLPVSPNPVPVVVPVTGLPFVPNNEGAARAAALAAAMNLQHNLARIQADAMPEHYEAELEINDFPQNARWKVTHKETLGPISDWTGAAITTRGQFFPPGKVPGPGERKLYLFIEGPTEQSVKRAKADLKRVLEDITNQTYQLPGGTQPGKYSVV